MEGDQLITMVNKAVSAITTRLQSKYRNLGSRSGNCGVKVTLSDIM